MGDRCALIHPWQGLSLLDELLSCSGKSLALSDVPIPMVLTAGDKQLTKHFDSTVSAAGGTVRAVKVAKRKGPDGKPLSAGYGFVECSSEAVAKVVLRKLQVSTFQKYRSCSAGREESDFCNGDLSHVIVTLHATPCSSPSTGTHRLKHGAPTSASSYNAPVL